MNVKFKIMVFATNAIRTQALAPSNRPIQVIENLALFWREIYPKLKRRRQRRYSKLDWR
jgi:ATP-dependent helicase HrpB